MRPLSINPQPMEASPPKFKCVRGKSHHWKLTTPSGPTVKGKCLNCRRIRNFRSGMTSYEAFGSILTDPLPERTFVNQYSVLHE